MSTLSSNSAPVERPVKPSGPIYWLRQNLFRTPLDTALSLLVGLIVLWFLASLYHWVVGQAQWAVITDNFRVLMAGLYPEDGGWRLSLAVIIVTGLAGLSWGIWGRMFANTGILLAVALIGFFFVPAIQNLSAEGALAAYFSDQVVPLMVVVRDAMIILILSLGIGYGVGALAKRINRKLAGRVVLLAWFILIPLSFVLVRGLNPNTPSLPFVPTTQWGGLLLTFMLAFVAIVACFPLGVLLALGRSAKGRSTGKGLIGWWTGLGNYPIVKLFCIAYIEFFRGVPLVTVFFTANLVVGYALGNANVDAIVRAMVALTLFEAAYIAEIVRGRLQSLPPGQLEAAKAMGLNPLYAMIFITMPQALRAVIPALVGQFITMFKDTSLVAIIGLTELMGMANAVTAQGQFTENKRETYVFVAIVYFIFSYGMSYAARQLERSGSGKARRL
jgi:general L-amino acid transport system permease protein